MAEQQVWALTNVLNVVEQVIVADQAFIDALPAQIADSDVDTGALVAHTAYDVTDVDPRPAAGWLRVSGGGWTPPTTLVTDAVRPIGPGETVRFTFTDHRPEPWRVDGPVSLVAGEQILRELTINSDGVAAAVLGYDDLAADRPDDLDPDEPWLVYVIAAGAYAVVELTTG